MTSPARSAENRTCVQVVAQSCIVRIRDRSSRRRGRAFARVRSHRTGTPCERSITRTRSSSTVTGGPEPLAADEVVAELERVSGDFVYSVRASPTDRARRACRDRGGPDAPAHRDGGLRGGRAHLAPDRARRPHLSPGRLLGCGWRATPRTSARASTSACIGAPRTVGYREVVAPDGRRVARRSSCRRIRMRRSDRGRCERGDPTMRGPLRRTVRDG